MEEEEQEVQSVDEVDAPRLTLAPILTTPGDGGSRRGSAAPLTFAEPLSIDNSLYSLNQLDGTTTGTGASYIYISDYRILCIEILDFSHYWRSPFFKIQKI